MDKGVDLGFTLSQVAGRDDADRVYPKAFSPGISVCRPQHDDQWIVPSPPESACAFRTFNFLHFIAALCIISIVMKG
jgi:hypothetical protein